MEEPARAEVDRRRSCGSRPLPWPKARQPESTWSGCGEPLGRHRARGSLGVPDDTGALSAGFPAPPSARGRARSPGRILERASHYRAMGDRPGPRASRDREPAPRLGLRGTGGMEGRRPADSHRTRRVRPAGVGSDRQGCLMGDGRGAGGRRRGADAAESEGEGQLTPGPVPQGAGPGVEPG